ncbi:MAG: hemolysin family protein [Proteiniphilum sp.]|jgi:putative hemolysin|nr:hemolysin family protein [Proteiniphilum sp.]MDD3956654.1 hemolysin family protein [Proteiniphilum sp.]MDD4452311.1 hemolysin family protein [Proteiniphilum sp.]
MSDSVLIGWWITLFLSVFFSGTEVAFVSSDKLQYAVRKKSTGGYHYMLNSIYGHPRQFLGTLMVWKVTLLVLFVYLSYLIISPQLSMRLESELLVMLIFIVTLSLLMLLMDEFLPRIFFQKNANFWVSLFVIPAFICYILMYPVARLFLWVSRGILQLFGLHDQRNDKEIFSRIDLDTYVRQSLDDMSKESEVDSEMKIFRNALDFSSTKIRDCMVPRADIVAVSIDTSLDILKEKFIETGISRILVFKNDIDNIVGYIHMWEIFNKPSDWTQNVATISFVPESMPANQLMSDLMQQRKSIAVVVDEFGGTSGIVTMEDLVEEIFGEIEDEYDVESKFVKPEGEGEYVLSGRVEIDHLNEVYGLDIPESDDYSTVAGYLLHHTQRFPKTYETVIIGKYTFKILKVTARKIEVVRLIVQQATV